MKPKFITSISVSLLALLASASLAFAQTTLYWDGGTVDIGTNGNGVSAGGAGDWDNTLGENTTNWDQGPGLAHVAWVNANFDTAFFGGTAGTVTLTDPITVGGLTFFSNSGYTIAAGSEGLTFGATNNTISLVNQTTLGTSSATISGTVAGNNVIFSSLNRSVASTLNFTGATTGGYTGTTTIGANTTVTLDGADSLNRNLLNTSGITLNGGAISSGVIANNANGSADRINNAANWTVNSGSFSWGSSNAGGTYAETIGSVSLNSGQMNFSLLGNLSSGSQELTLGSVSGVGLSQTGTAAVTFSNNATNLTTAAGNNRIRVFGITTSTAAGEIIAPWATVGASAAAQTDYARYVSDGTHGYVVAAGGTLTTPGQSGWGSAATAYQFAAGETLTADRTAAALRYTGAANALALGGFTLKTNGILNGGSGLLTVSGAGALTATGVSGGNLYLTAGSNAITVSSAINDNGDAVTVVKNGANNLTLSSTTSNFSGGTVVNAGTLTWTANTNLGLAGSRNITVNGTATLAGFDGTSLNALTVGSGGVATITGTSSYTFTSTSGSGAIISQGTTNKTVSLGNASSFTGNLALAFNNNNASGLYTTPHLTFSSLNDAVGSALQIYRIGGGTDSGQIGQVALTGNTGAVQFDNRQIQLLPRTGTTNSALAGIALINNNATAANRWIINTPLLNLTERTTTLHLAGTNTGANAFNGTIGNSQAGFALSVLKASNGSWTIGGNNTYSGGTTVSAGTLNASAANALGTGNVTVTAGTLVIGAADAIADSAGLFLPSAAAKNLTMNFSDTVGSLFLAGLQQPNGSYSSGTNASAWMNTGSGILMVGSAAAQPIYWDLDDATPGAGGATPTGTWNAGNMFWNNPAGDGTAAAWSAGATAAFSAGTNATGDYTVTVDGTQDIGGLTFEEGNVTLSGGTALRLVSDSLASVASGLTATVSTSLTQDTSARALTKIGAGTLILANANTFSGAMNFGAGTLRLAHLNAVGSSSAVNVNAGALTLQLRSDTAGTFGGGAVNFTPTANAQAFTINVDNNGSGTNNQLVIGEFNRRVNVNQNTAANGMTLNVTGANGYSLSIPTMNLTGGMSTTVKAGDMGYRCART